MKKEIVQIRISKDEKDSIVAVAKKLDVSTSRFVREAVREKIAKPEYATPQGYATAERIEAAKPE